MQECKHYGCTEPTCALCKNNNKKRCADDDNFDGGTAGCAAYRAPVRFARRTTQRSRSRSRSRHISRCHSPPCTPPPSPSPWTRHTLRRAEAYADNQVLRAKCDADLSVELFNTASGQRYSQQGVDIRVGCGCERCTCGVKRRP